MLYKRDDFGSKLTKFLLKMSSPPQSPASFASTVSLTPSPNPLGLAGHLCPEGRESSGSEQSQQMPGPSQTTCPPLLRGSRANASWDPASAVMNIGSLLSPSPRRVLWPRLNSILEELDTGSSLDRLLQNSMCGKTQLLCWALGLKEAANLLRVITPTTGNLCGSSLLLEAYERSPLRYEFRAIGPCGQSARTIYARWQWSECVAFSGGKLVLVRREEPGKMLAYLATLKIPEPSFGMVTEAKTMLLSMSFAEQSTSATYCDGVTVIRSLWRLKETASLSQQRILHSHPTYTPDYGFQE